MKKSRNKIQGTNRTKKTKLKKINSFHRKNEKVNNTLELSNTDNKFINILKNTFVILFFSGVIFTLFSLSMSIASHNDLSPLNIAVFSLCLMIVVPALTMFLSHLYSVLSWKYKNSKSGNF